jgi:hypothetical protein
VVSELLSPVVREDENSMFSSLGAIQRSSAIPLRLDETNDISCKGRPGVSNSFASALWATDYLARALAAGIRGLDFHDLISKPGAYSPLIAVANRRQANPELHPNPEWYALLLAHYLRGAKPVQATVSGARNLTAWAFVSHRGAVRLVLVNFEPTTAAPLHVKVHIPGRFAGGTILRLTAPSPDATSRVRLGGREVTPSGDWSARLPLPGVHDGRGSLSLALAPSSAALVTLEPGSAKSR